MAEKRIYFISRAGADSRWAALIAGVVRDAGHEAIHQDEDFQYGTSFIENMRAASANSDCTIAVLSPAYFESPHCMAELNAALAPDPNGLRGQILPVLVDRCDLPPDIAHLTYVDLVGADEDMARKRLRNALFKHGPVDHTNLALIGRSRRDVEQANRNRLAMIEKVRTIWITGFLQESLFDEARVILGLSKRPDAVARPLDLLVRRPEQGEQPIPPGTEVVDVFDSMDQSLLILGSPGAGKTTLLLELARDLLDRAAPDPAHPIPVVFPLSTWAASRKPLVEWLVDELNLRYDVPRKLAQAWVASDQILPLLDGLDEVKVEHRAACADAIDEFRQSHGLLPLVITSRTADYKALAKPLRLHGAILVHPLSRDAVNAYLANLGPAGEPVRAAIQEDSSLWELLDSPLLLNVVTMAYGGQGQMLPLTSGTVAERRDRLFGSYVNQMLQRRAAERRYAPEQTVHWLSWLADQMVNHDQTVFYLERLQRDWLPVRQRWAIRVCNVMVIGLFVGLVAGLFGGLAGGLVVGLVVGLVIGLVFGLVGVRGGRQVSDQEINCIETVRWSRTGTRDALPFVRTAGLVCGLIFSGVVGLGWMQRAVPIEGLVAGLFVGLVAGLFVGLVAGLFVGLVGLLFVWLFGGLSFGEIEIRALPNEGIRRSARNAIVFGLFGGLAFGLVFGLFGGLGGGPYLGLVFGLFGGPFGMLAGGLRAGGEACLKHLVLRLWLIRNGSTPWKYVRFLDYAADRLLLRKVGGGYAFLHRMLLEYFAARYVEPGASQGQDSGPGGES